MAPEITERSQPERVGPYTLVEILGEGGMAIVYLARQEQPVRRTVALKVIKPGLDSRQILARFEAERQALALLEHPHIASIFDAGATETGRPFFVMERVVGSTITAHCDKHRLDVRSRVQLFIDICEAVQHAHQKGVMHRDLKPSNLLVDESGERPLAKVIDFGIAKMFAQSAPEHTQFTRLGQFVGTPQYMSPEQAEGDVDVDTRTDVYSLGVVLYELLAGTVPLDLQQVADYAIGVALRERDPPTPSHRVSTAADDVAHRRDTTDVGALSRSLRGDLDWIVMKAIAKDRAARYATVNDLASDLRRYLEQRPVLARPPSTRYLLARFVRRNKLMVGAAAFATLALLSGLAIATTGLMRARAAEHRALTEADKAQQAIHFLTDLFELSDPGKARGRTVTAREILDEAALRLDAELSASPATRAMMMTTIADIYSKLGLYEAAQPLTESALDLRRSIAPASVEVADSLDQLGMLLTSLGHGTSALAQHEQALNLRRALAPQDVQSMARTLRYIGAARLSQSRFREAVADFREARHMLQSQPHGGGVEAGRVASQLADAYDALGDRGEAERLYREADSILRRELGNDHPYVVSNLHSLAILLKEIGRFEDAERALDEVLSIQRRMLGEAHPDIADSLNSRAMLMMAMGRNDEALAAAQESVRIYGNALGEEHDQTNTVRLNEARIYVRMRNLVRAEEEFRAVLAIRRRTLPADHDQLATTLDALAAVLNQTGRHREAELMASEARDIYVKTRGPLHYRTASAEIGVGEALAGQRRFAEAEIMLRHACDTSQAAGAGRAAQTRACWRRQAALYRAWGKMQLAAQVEAKIAASGDTR